MSPRDLLYETWVSLTANKARSLLTILGIVIGIASVIAMTSLIAGVQGMFMNELGLSQARVVSIYANASPFTNDDIDNLERFFPEYETITTIVNGYASATGSEGNSDLNIIGVDETYFTIDNVKLKEGRLITADDCQRNSQVVILGRGQVKQLFGSEDAQALGQSIRIGSGSDSFTVIGVLESNRNDMYYMQSFMPATTLQKRIMGVQPIYQIITIATEGTDVVDLAKRTQEFLNNAKGEEVFVYSMQEVIDELETTLAGFSVMLISIASIALFVGGIGIMNMMLTNVTERTREIGLRKSLGAHTGDIVLQFLVESIALCLVGGVLGIIFGYLGSIGLAVLINASQAIGPSQIVPIIGLDSIAITVGVCAFIGIVFGFYPARRAAKLDPVESLRYQ